MGATGDKVLARYSFVYVYENGQWKIAHHHSSVMPEGLLAKNDGEVLADGEVRALFKLVRLQFTDVYPVAKSFCSLTILAFL
jgi:hypothetical protein